MHDLAFADATRPTQVALFGLLLRDYSIGHELLLQRLRNPLLVQTEAQFDALTETEQRGAIGEAALVCHHTWDEWDKFHVELFAPLKIKILARRWRKRDYLEPISKFREYRRQGMTWLPSPTDWANEVANGKDEIGGRLLGGPYLARLLNFACSLPPFIAPNPLDVPLGFCQFLYQCKLEEQGLSKIENETEAEIKEEYREHREHFEKEEAARMKQEAHHA